MKEENMTEFVIKIAGCPIGGAALYESTRDFCREYLSDETPKFSVTMTQENIDLERELSAREDLLEGRRVQNHSDVYLETIALQRKIARKLISHDILLFHGSTVAVGEACYLFTAKSGTGKSTHVRLWRELLGQQAVMVNDDKPFLHIGQDAVTAFGTPWNGKHHLGTNIAVPLKAICVLERGEENSIRAITAKEALTILFQQSHRPADSRLMGKYLELLDGLANGVAFYRLQCNMDPQAAALAYEVMSGEKKG